MKLRQMTIVLAAAVVGCFSASVDAASITWSAATNQVADTDVVNTGTVITALDLGSTASSLIINGVTFTTNAGVGGLTGGGIGTYGDVFTAGSGPWASLSTNYKDLLADAAESNTAGPTTLTFGGLATGNSYLFQWWISDPRGAFVPARTTTASDGTNFVTLAGETTNTAGDVGQYAIGTFIADGTGSQTITFTANVVVHVSAYQLRDVTAVPEPGAISLIGCGIVGFVAVARRRRGVCRN